MKRRLQDPPVGADNVTNTVLSVREKLSKVSDADRA